MLHSTAQHGVSKLVLFVILHASYGIPNHHSFFHSLGAMMKGTVVLTLILYFFFFLNFELDFLLSVPFTTFKIFYCLPLSFSLEVFCLLMKGHTTVNYLLLMMISHISASSPRLLSCHFPANQNFHTK